MNRYQCAFIVLFLIIIVPISSHGQSYEDYCDQTFQSGTYPGLNEFCLYLVSSGPLVDVQAGLPGYSHLFMKDEYGIFHDYSISGYPTINFIQLMDNHAADLKSEHDLLPVPGATTE